MPGWKHALARTRSTLSGMWDRLRGRSALDADTAEALEEALLGADVAAGLVAEWMDKVDDYRGITAPRDMLANLLRAALPVAPPYDWATAPSPSALLVVGVNGSGKTTTCAKLAQFAARAGRKPLLAAADTFRAAGADQLRLWAERIGCDVVAGQTGGDAAAVVFDAAAAMESRNHDLLIIDTAGRMHTREPLMRELEKMRRALAKRMPGEPAETWIVLDAAMGQNAIHQARFFHKAAPLTGVVIAKLDGSSKAGFVFSIVRELGIPIRYAGLGEGVSDLVPFDAPAFVSALLEDEDAQAGQPG